jgi:hypothetical protein
MVVMEESTNWLAEPKFVDIRIVVLDFGGFIGNDGNWRYGVGIMCRAGCFGYIYRALCDRWKVITAESQENK